MDTNKLDGKIRRSLCISTFLFTIAVLAAVLSALGIFKPDAESFGTWFQRSGSITVILAIIIEFKLFEVNNDLYTSRIHFNELTELKLKYETPYRILTVFTALVAIVGTVIWGYGDLLWSFI